MSRAGRDLRLKTNPVLANCLGKYAETAPAPVLREHFRCAWTNLLPERDVSAVAVVPDGCIDLLWRDERFLVVGPDVTAATPPLRPGTIVLGIRFKPGAAARWLGLSMTEIVGREIDMQDIWGQKARLIAERMQEARSPDKQFGLLQELLGKTASSIEAPPPDAGIMFDLLREGTGHEPDGMRHLSRTLDVSERTLRRRSHDLFGYGPKTLQRILRFQNFLSSVRTCGDRGLADMAYAAGYADQAHLSREIRSLCGMTPGEFVRQIAA
ncbi:helix-turn-helix domain-containing protein [Aquamicrobium sp. LC103]|uniref:helix-turn-helix domain-containing protein n=1 Tax=Aquamicrobium sp. LC103 TaxID=1120658 RepID=UPI0032B13D41